MTTTLNKLAGLFLLSTISFQCCGSDLPVLTQDDTNWCPPNGPGLPALLPADHSLLLKPGWVTLQMHVHPGEELVTDVRVVSEAGGPSHAWEWLPLVRQWRGCAENRREVLYQVKFTFSYQGAYHLPTKEAFGLYAFKQPVGAPKLPEDDWGTGVCPIKATLLLRQPTAKNDVRLLESEGGARVRTWLEGLNPDRSYMTPSANGNRVEFDCAVTRGQVVFREQ